MLLQLADGCQAVYGIASETADALSENESDFSSEGVLNHVIEAVTALGAGTADTLVRVNADELPLVVSLNVGGIVITLRLVAVLLILVVRADARVSGYLPLCFHGDWSGCEAADRCGNFCHCCHLG